MYNILIVDDNSNNRLTIQLLLEDIDDLKIQEAKDGVEAVEICKRENFDLIFMDIMMPKMDGFEATMEIKKLSKNVMIIALSALDDKDSTEKMLHYGAEDYLIKPVNPEVFIQRTRNYLKIASYRNQKLLNIDAINPFSKEIFSRVTTFNIRNEAALAEFWDYWLNDTRDIIDLSNYVRFIYGFGLWLLKNNKHCVITCEENEQNLYFTQSNISFIKQYVITKILFSNMPEAKYILSGENLSFKLEKNKIESINTIDEEKDILTRSHDEKMAAMEYLENTPLSIIPKIEDLESVEDDLHEAIIDFEKNPETETMKEVSSYFEEYYRVLELLVEFENIGFSIKRFIDFLNNLDNEQLGSLNTDLFSSMLLSFLEDLSSWRENIFIKRDALDIHYLDASLLSSCLQIEGLFSDDTLDEEGEFEFF